MWRTFLARGIDVLTIIAAGLFVFAAVSRYVKSDATVEAQTNAFEPGTTLGIGITQSTGGPATLALALQKGCRYCEASMPLYRDLLGSDTENRIRVVALFPGAASEGRVFLHEHLGNLDAKVKDIRTVNFDAVGIKATPTLLLLDNRGRVQASWVGQLSSKQEAALFGRLQITRVPDGYRNNGASSSDETPPPDLITADQFALLEKATPGIPIVDVDPRPEFSRSHPDGALNIPVDELEDRAPHEVPANAMIVVYCNYCPPCEKATSSEKGNSNCTFANIILRQLGFSQIKMLSADSDQLIRTGVKIDVQ